jgi:hypothetical protein
LKFFFTFAPAFTAKGWLKGRKEIGSGTGLKQDESGELPEKISRFFLERMSEIDNFGVPNEKIRLIRNIGRRKKSSLNY